MTTNTPPQTIVLVHGAWADGSSWSRLITALLRMGVPVTAAPIPLTSLPDDVTALDRAIDRVGGPVVLVGHAYAGAVIGASTHSQVKALIYVAALAPDEGETVADVFYRAAPHPDAPTLEPDRDGYIWLPTGAFPAAFAQHATAQEHAVLAAVQRPISVACIQQPVPPPRWKQVPSWFFLAEQDRMIDPATQAFMAQRMGADIRSHPADHAPLITAPAAVAELIGEALAELQTRV